MRNKNILIAAAFGIATVLSISVTAQKRMLEIYQNGKVSHSVEVADIDSIKINSNRLKIAVYFYSLPLLLYK